MRRTACFVLACALMAGCSFYARGPQDYRSAVRKLLEQRRPEVATCYKQSYEKDDSVQGRVMVSFEVEPKTGKLVKPTVVPAGTTANDVLQQCVLASLDGLALAPPDQRTGAATFTWEFAR